MGGPANEKSKRKEEYSRDLGRIEHEEDKNVVCTSVQVSGGNWRTARIKERSKFDVEEEEKEVWRVSFSPERRASARRVDLSRPFGGSSRPHVFATSVSGARGTHFTWDLGVLNYGASL